MLALDADYYNYTSMIIINLTWIQFPLQKPHSLAIVSPQSMLYSKLYWVSIYNNIEIWRLNKLITYSFRK